MQGANNKGNGGEAERGGREESVSGNSILSTQFFYVSKTALSKSGNQKTLHFEISAAISILKENKTILQVKRNSVVSDQDLLDFTSFPRPLWQSLRAVPWKSDSMGHSLKTTDHSNLLS